MPQIKFKNKTFQCPKGASLREVLLLHELSPHNGASKYLNCFGLGTCGTCTVKLTGKVHPLTPVEKIRLNLPPHRQEDGLRLSCQVVVEHDLEVEKWEGFWGHEMPPLAQSEA